MRDELTKQARTIVRDEIVNGERDRPKSIGEFRQAVESVRRWLCRHYDDRSWSREWNGLYHE